MTRLFRHNSWVKNIVRIDWDLGNYCNFNCSYCPVNTKQGNFSNPGIDIQKTFASDMLDYYDSIGKRPVILFGASGEPTIYSEFPALLKFLHNRVAEISVRTNLSAGVEWWKENGYLIHDVHGTVHYQNGVTLKTTYETISQILQYARNVTISVPMLPDLFDKQIEDIEWLKGCSTISIAPQPILQNLYSGGYWINYTDKQKDELAKYYQFESHSVSTHENTSSTLSDIVKKTSFEVVFNEQDTERCFTGWKCFAGIDTLVIDSRGYVRKGWCAQLAHEQKHMTEWTWNSNPFTCNMSSCRMHHDLFARKELD